MVAKHKDGTDRRGNSQAKLATLVQTRTETLSLYAELAGQQPFDSGASISETLQEFCEALIDYTASAHFQLYRFIEGSQERRNSVLQIADEVYAQIAQTTDAILDFNDKYEKASLKDCVDVLPDDLSKLGEALADRIQLEDQMIGAMAASRH